MTAFQDILLAVAQGSSELLPISNLEHAVIVPTVPGWSLNERNRPFVTYSVIIGLGSIPFPLRT